MAELEVTTKNKGQRASTETHTLETGGQALDESTIELVQLDPVTGQPTGNTQQIKITNS